MMTNGVMVIWVYTTLDPATVDDFEEFFKDEGFTVKFVEEFKDLKGHPHILFNLYDNIGKFAVYRLRRGGDMKWFDDYIMNYHDEIPPSIKEKYDIKDIIEEGGK